MAAVMTEMKRLRMTYAVMTVYLAHPRSDRAAERARERG
jgi:hypothetical protein